MAGNAQFYLGEISYRQGKFPAAIKYYDAVLEQFSGNPKAPAAELRKGQSLLKLGQKDAGVRELRTLVQRYPQTPEAQEGRSALNGMGVRIMPPNLARIQQYLRRRNSCSWVKRPFPRGSVSKILTKVFPCCGAMGPFLSRRPGKVCAAAIIPGSLAKDGNQRQTMRG